MTELLLETQPIYCLDTRVAMALDRLRAFCPPEGYYLAYSGGKDSTVLLDLARQSGVAFDTHYNLTSVDPPELVRFIRQQDGVTVERPEMTMWGVIMRNLYPPQRQQRWCCKWLKEHGGDGRTVLTGVRWEESLSRSKRRMVEDRTATGGKVCVNPIIDWTEREVWQYIRERELPYCSLYDEGFTRLGCILCPQQGSKGMRRDAERWPGYARAYVRTFDRVVAERKRLGKRCTWESGQELFDWWVSGAGEVDADQQCFLYQ